MDLDELFRLVIRSWTIYSLAALCAITLLALISRRGGRRAVRASHKASTAPHVVLTGPMAGGKTTLLSRLVYSTAPATHTSMTATTVDIPELSMRVTDIPGHTRLRTRILADILPSADGVVFCIDPSLHISTQQVHLTAEFLHVILSFLHMLQTKTGRSLPLLILLTMSDTWSATQRSRMQDRVRTALGREMEKRKSALASATASHAKLESIDALPSDSSVPFSLSSFFSGFINTSVSSRTPANGVSLPQDEQEVLQSDVLNFDGSFDWAEEKLGVVVDFGTNGSEDKLRAILDEKPAADISEKAASDSPRPSLLCWIDERVR